MEEIPRTAKPETRLDTGVGEESEAYAEESDWDEYADEIASAVAFTSWQEASAPQLDWDEDEAEVAARGEVHGFGENWEDWPAIDELEDDVTYHSSMEKSEEQ